MSDPTNALGQAPSAQAPAQNAAPAPVLSANDLIAAAVTPVVQQVATDVATGLHTESLALISGLSSRVTATELALQDAVTKAGAGVLRNVEEDPLTQRIIAVMVVAALLLAGLGILAFAMLGNATANRWIAGAPIAIGAAVLWVSRYGVPLTKKVPSPVTGK